MSSAHRPDSTRARLVAAADSAFAERGYTGTTVHDICAAADLSVGSFYYHFEDKASITLAIFERENERFVQQLESMDLRRAGTVEATIREILYGPGAPLYRALREAAQVEPRVGQYAAELRRVTQDRLAAAVTRARQNNASHHIGAPSIAWVILALLRAGLSTPTESEEPLPRWIADLIHQAVMCQEVPDGASARS